MSNITSVVFDKCDEMKAIYGGLWQYDYGQILRIEGLNLPPAVEIHFSLQDTGGEAKRRIGFTKSGVTDVVIPDFILEGNDATRNYDAYAFIYLSDEESGETTHKIKMQIKARSKPEGSSKEEDTSFGAIMDAVNKIAEQSGQGVSDEKIAEAVNAYMEENPVKGTADAVQYISQNLTKEQQTQARTNIGAASAEEFSQLSDTVNNHENRIKSVENNTSVGGSGMTQAQINALDGMFKVCAYDSTKDYSGAYTAFKQAFGIESGGGETEVTLSSISATYNGGSVLVGTSVNTLTGIVVTARYSDGTTKTVTGYTLSGTISEGSNTITVSYGGKTTTITVIGYVEQEEVTLSSISASYTGGEVAVGTALTDLTGITVTTHYSDGSTVNVTGYTLNGTIAEGENTITVSYGGLTTTFKVTGVAESSGGAYGVDLTFEYPDYGKWSTNGNWYLTHYSDETASIQVGNGFSKEKVYSKPIDGTAYKYFRVPTESEDKQHGMHNYVEFFGCNSPNALTEAGHTVTKCTKQRTFVPCDFDNDLSAEGMTIFYPSEQFDYYYIKYQPNGSLTEKHPTLLGVFDADILENPLANPTE